MARYRVSHDIDRDTWIAKNPDGTFRWATGEGYKAAHLFPNYKAARAALDSLPEEKRMYNESYKKRVHFMKFYDNEEHMKREDAYRENKRILRDWGH